MSVKPASRVSRKARVPYNYLDRQYSRPDRIWKAMRELVRTGDFTLGAPVLEFERRLAEFVGARHCLGTNTGTSALILSLKGLGVGPGDEVITQPNTFYATVGAIVAVGARPVFVDVGEDYQIDVGQIEAAMTPKTKAIMPVHWTGFPVDLGPVMEIAGRRNLVVIEDACAAIGAGRSRRSVGTWGHASAFSFHPLKQLNAWGDGGAIVTEDERLIRWLKLYRNHGMTSRDEIEIWGLNERLQSIQAVVLLEMLGRLRADLARRMELADRVMRGLQDVPEIRIPRRDPGVVHAYQIFVVRASRRDGLLKHLAREGVEAKVHYPIPLHLQKAARPLGYKEGDFPMAEEQARDIVTLPLNQYLTNREVDAMVDAIRRFYRR